MRSSKSFQIIQTRCTHAFNKNVCVASTYRSSSRWWNRGRWGSRERPRNESRTWKPSLWSSQCRNPRDLKSEFLSRRIHSPYRRLEDRNRRWKKEKFWAKGKWRKVRENVGNFFVMLGWEIRVWSMGCVFVCLWRSWGERKHGSPCICIVLWNLQTQKLREGQISN